MANSSWIDPDHNGSGNVSRAHGLLLIGSHSTIERPIIGLRELLSVRWHTHSSYTMPSDDILARVKVVFVYDVEENRRYQQLARCCDYQRECGVIQTIYAVLRFPDVDLAHRVVNELGAQFRFIGEAGFGPVKHSGGTKRGTE